MEKDPKLNKKKAFNNSVKTGSSDSKLDFVKDNDDFYTNEEEEFDDDSSVVLDDDFDETSDVAEDEDEEEYIEEITVDEPREDVKGTKPGKITVISRKIPVKKLQEKGEVEKEINKLLKNYSPDATNEEIKNFLDISPSQREQMITGEINFTGRNNATIDEKKELFTKLDEISATEDVRNANAAFVLKWLKGRNSNM